MKRDCLLVTIIGLLLFNIVSAVEAVKPEIFPSATWPRQGEFLIDTSLSPLDQCNPAVAFDGTNYLIAWGHENEIIRDIYAARVSPIGIVLDPPIVLESGWQSPRNVNPTVAFDGTNYLVVFMNLNWMGAPMVEGMRVSTDGIVIDICNSFWIAWTTTPPSIAFDGNNYLVLWSGVPTEGVHGRRVTPGGNTLESFVIATGYAEQYPSVAFDGTNYLAVWQCSRNDSCDIYGARVSPTGIVLDPTGIAISTAIDSQRLPTVAFDGTNYLVVWQDRRNGSEYDIYGTRVSPSGTVFDPAGTAISTATGNQCAPSVAFDGNNCVIAWEDERSVMSSDIYGAIMNTSGMVIDSFAVSIQPGDQITPALAHGPGDQILVTYSGWTDSINGQPVNTMRIWGKFYPFVGIEQGEARIVKQQSYGATIFRGPLHLPEGEKCKVFDITGRAVEPDKIQPGIYFIEVDGIVVQKIVKVR